MTKPCEVSVTGMRKLRDVLSRTFTFQGSNTPRVTRHVAPESATPAARRPAVPRSRSGH